MKKLKKGFTLVELVIVIAVIAVLAAVLIPVFSGIMQRARVENDIKVIQSLNTALENKNPQNMSEVIEIANDKDISVNKMVATANGYNMVYDQVNNRFALLDENNKVVYQTAEENKSVDVSKLYALWKVVQTNEQVSDETNFSVYLTGNSCTEVININGIGFDVGNNTGITKINYTNSSESVKNVTIVTNSEATILTINDTTNSKITQQGVCGIIEASVGTDSLYLDNSDVNFVEMKEGHLVVETGSSVDMVYANTTEQKTVTIDKQGTGTIGQALVASGKTASGNVSCTTTTKEVKVLKDEVAATANSQEYATLQNKEARILDTGFDTVSEAIASAQANDVVVLLKDVTLTARLDTNYSGIFDFCGHKITTTNTCGNGSAINVVTGTLIIKNGYIDGTTVTGTTNSQQSPYGEEVDAITVRSGATVNIYDMNIDVKSTTGSCVYTFNNAYANIYSGTYKNTAPTTYSNDKQMCLNQADVATQFISVYGGVFYGINPALGDNSGVCTTFLATGYQSTGTSQDDVGVWTITQVAE